ncbi:hypothetical protein FSP39_004740 [Pinctada imbricata]|uniref:Mab-21-like nucleotidyltransferase domain-containing protein n=1 Tax=Pinctada imbricata TaxID=66713 RepID=A0AA89BWG0_PINIB|nr:hypothetical protein FSP39_004740 [Pinctada imbricata]
MAGSTEERFTDGIGRTPLHLAANSNKLDELETLLKSRNYDVNGKDLHGDTALHHLLDDNVFDELEDLKRGVQLLLDAGSDINIQNKLFETPLHCVFNSYDRFAPDIIRYILENSKLQYNHFLKDNTGYTVFYKFMVGFRQSLQERDDFDEIVEETEKIVNEFLSGRFTALSTVKELLNDKDVFGSSAFHTYSNVVEYSIDTIKHMINCGADVNTASNIGITPLMDAIYVRETPIVKVLLESGANPNVVNIFGQSSMFRVFTIKDFELLCKHGVHLNTKDKYGRTPLNEMFLYTSEQSPKSGITLSESVASFPPLAEILIERGLNPNERDMYNSTPLHYAAWYGHPDMTSILLKHGADPELSDKSGFTPYDLALRFENFDICNLLKPDQETSKDTFDNIIKYSNVYVSFKDIDKMDNLLRRALEFNDDPVELVNEALKSKRVGLVERQENSLEVKSDILNFMRIIADKISTNHPLFRCSVFHVGSSADGSKIGDPDELDFMFCLEYFSEECIPYQEADTINSGFAVLKVKSIDEKHLLAPFVSKELFIESHLVRDEFKDVFTEAVNSPEVWQGAPSLSFDGLMEFKNEKPNINMHIDYFGPIMKNITVSLDIVPAVIFPQWSPVEMKDRVLKTPQGLNGQNKNYVLLFQPPEELDLDHRRLLRISSSICELSFIRDLPPPYKDSYAVAKILVSEYFCPKILLQDNVDVESIFKEAQKKSQGNNDGIVHDSDSEAEDYDDVNSENDTDCEEDDTITRDSAEHVETTVLSDNDSVSVLKGAILINNGELNPLSCWIIELEDGIVNKLFTPMKANVSPNLSMELGKEHSILETKCQLLTVQKGNKTWHWWGPYEGRNDIEGSDNDFEDDFVDDDEMTVSEWITKKLKKHLESELRNKPIGLSSEANQIDQSSRPLEQDMECSTTETAEASNIRMVMEAGSIEDKLDSSKMQSNQVNREISDGTMHWEGGEILHANGEISSYMLKNCLFEIAADLSFSQNVEKVDIIVKLFEKLKYNAQLGKLNVYFLPFLDVFSFSKAQIHMKSEENIKDEIEVQCTRIQWFCQIILSILKQSK